MCLVHTAAGHLRLRLRQDTFQHAPLPLPDQSRHHGQLLPCATSHLLIERRQQQRASFNGGSNRGCAKVAVILVVGLDQLSSRTMMLRNVMEMHAHQTRGNLLRRCKVVVHAPVMGYGIPDRVAASNVLQLVATQELRGVVVVRHDLGVAATTVSRV